VMDFFDFRIWPVFNVADIAICVGVGCIIWSILLTEWQEKNKNA
ncbi:MAG: signal peptidase II, partial [Phascolarctobacterium sp.]